MDHWLVLWSLQHVQKMSLLNKMKLLCNVDCGRQIPLTFVNTFHLQNNLIIRNSKDWKLAGVWIWWTLIRCFVFDFFFFYSFHCRSSARWELWIVDKDVSELKQFWRDGVKKPVKVQTVDASKLVFIYCRQRRWIVQWHSRRNQGAHPNSLLAAQQHLAKSFFFNVFVINRSIINVSDK